MTEGQKTMLRRGLVLLAVYLVSVFGGTWLMRINPKDNSDPPEGRSGLGVHTDHLTGCQYLSKGSSLTPRLDAKGYQVGCRS